MPSDLWVATGRGGAGTPYSLIATSPDGAVWTGQTTPADSITPSDGGFCVAYGNGLWLAGLEFVSGITLMSSPDAVTWTTRMDSTHTDVVWALLWVPSLGLWVAGLDGNPTKAIATSPDGIAWSLQTTPFDGLGCAVEALATDGSLVVAGGVDAAGNKVLMTSPDAVSWTVRTTPFDSVGGFGYVDGLAWSSALSLWIAVGADAAGTKCVMTSPDAVTWTARTTPLDTVGANCVDVNSSLVVVGTQNDAGVSLMTSPDAVTWTTRTVPWNSAPSPGATVSVRWSDAQSQWEAGANIGSQVGVDVLASSPDGITWTAHSSPFTGGIWAQGIAFRPAPLAPLSLPLVRATVVPTPDPLAPTSSAEPLVRVTTEVTPYLTQPTPTFAGTGPGNHEYEVIVVNEYGYAYGQINSAVVTEVDEQLDDIGSALIDFWIMDPSASVLSVQDLPGGKEIQIWRDGSLMWWGVPVGASFDAASVHLSCSGLTWYFSTRNFGPNPFNYVVNPGFETGDLTGWEVVNCRAEVNAYGGWLGIPLEGKFSAILPGNLGIVAGIEYSQDGYIRQLIPFTTGPEPVTYDLSAWCYNMLWDVGASGPYIPPFGSRGLYLAALVGGEPILGTPQVANIDGSTPQGQWNRFDVSVVIPANKTGELEVRLYASVNNLIWDACNLTTNLAVGMNPALNPVAPTALLDAFYIMRNILDYAQDPAWGKSDVAIPVRGGLTGRQFIRLYNLSDNGGVLDALNEFPSIGACDFNMKWDITGHFRWLQIDAPASGAVRYNYPLELEIGNVTDLQGAIDGSQVGTAQRVLGQGSTGSSEDIGYAVFPSFIGGKATDGGGHVTLGSTTVVTGGGFFVPSDVGKPIYSLAQALPIGTLIASYINSGAVTVHTPHSADPDQGGLATLTNDTIGVGGLIIDVVQSAIQDLPITTLQGTAIQALVKQLAAQVIPAPKFKDDVDGSPWPFLRLGDVVPVSFSYGWLQLPGPLMRITGLTWSPQTDEVAPTLNVVNAVPS